MNKPRIVKESVRVKAAVVFDGEGFLHSAMVSGNSLWSAGQRVYHARKHGVRLCAKATELSISYGMAVQIRDALKVMEKKMRARAKRQEEALREAVGRGLTLSKTGFQLA